MGFPRGHLLLNPRCSGNHTWLDLNNMTEILEPTRITKNHERASKNLNRLYFSKPASQYVWNLFICVHRSGTEEHCVKWEKSDTEREICLFSHLSKWKRSASQKWEVLMRCAEDWEDGGTWKKLAKGHSVPMVGQSNSQWPVAFWVTMAAQHFNCMFQNSSGDFECCQQRGLIIVWGY